ncbi:MAG TPA: alpha/beta fold hydrolase [Acidimicrobiales bacterium]|nr:alpha/beta fold hydrolase [Acidimicrobiales bacterium]
MKPTVVLVHGAWHGAWCFDRVMPLLEDAGLPALAVDLPGHGKDAGPFVDLHGDAARVRSVLDGISGDVVLLGHSYGGAVVTEAGVHPAVKHVVYLCALALDAGESCASLLLDETVSLSHEGRPDIADGLLMHDDGTSTLTPSSAVACLYNDCDPDTVSWALAHLGPHPMENFGQTPSAVAWRERPSTYVVCSEDLVVHPGLQAVVAKRCPQSHVWPTSHSPFASEPGRLSRLLVDVAGTAIQ